MLVLRKINIHLVKFSLLYLEVQRVEANYRGCVVLRNKIPPLR